jgi:peptidoglycan/xylan/chitin deacetylase (PgdA/CDA1 family)
MKLQQKSISTQGRIVRLASAIAMLAFFAILPFESSRAAGQTVVSINFDDGYADQYAARTILSSHGMHATFYVNSGLVGTSPYASWAQLKDLYADGNEIGGHSLDHKSLKSLKGVALRHEVCDDRVNLFNQGFQPTSFAYPFGNYNSNTIQALKDCGYNSGRGVSGGPETIPPLDAYVLRPFPSVKGSTSLATIEGWITQTENAGGGWVQLVFHHVCNGCDVYSISPANLTALLDWLQPRAASGTVVRTINEVIGGAVKPPVPAQ